MLQPTIAKVFACDMEIQKMASHIPLAELENALKSCIDELEQLDALIAAAHAEAALQSMKRQFGLLKEPSKAD